MNVLDAIASRKSIRAFRPDPVPKDTIEKIKAAILSLRLKVASDTTFVQSPCAFVSSLHLTVARSTGEHAPGNFQAPAGCYGV